MTFDHVPIAASVGVERYALEEHGGRAVAQRPVNDVRVAGDPADVGHAGKNIAVVVVEDIAVGERGLQQVSRRGMGHALGAAGAARGVEKKERVLAVHVLDGAIGALTVHGLAQPDVALGIERNLVAGSPGHEHRAHCGAGHDRLVDGALERDGLATAHALVGGDHGRAARVVDAVT